MAKPRRDVPSAHVFAKLLRSRRSRRFAVGAETTSGPLAFTSTAPAKPLTEEQEAFLVFCATGITGFAFGDLVYDRENDGQMIGGFVGTTVPSADCIHPIHLVVVNDAGVYLMKSPNSLDVTEIEELVQLGRDDQFVELYRRTRIKLRDERAAPRLSPPFNVPVNKWDLYRPGTTYFLPVIDLTYYQINGALSFFGEGFGVGVLDERRMFRPAGLAEFWDPLGHLGRNGVVMTIQGVYALVQSSAAVEVGAMTQNLMLGAECLGLGAFANAAWDDAEWAKVLGFTMKAMPASRYLGMEDGLPDDQPYEYPVGLRGPDGEHLIRPYCVPHYPTMRDAIEAVLEWKFGERGVYGSRLAASGFRDPAAIRDAVAGLRPSRATIEATVAFCEYCVDTYGRFPPYPPALTTMVGVQVARTDAAFYQRFYRPDE